MTPVGVRESSLCSVFFSSQEGGPLERSLCRFSPATFRRVAVLSGKRLCLERRKYAPDFHVFLLSLLFLGSEIFCLSGLRFCGWEDTSCSVWIRTEQGGFSMSGIRAARSSWIHLLTRKRLLPDIWAPAFWARGRRIGPSVVVRAAGSCVLEWVVMGTEDENLPHFGTQEYGYGYAIFLSLKGDKVFTVISHLWSWDCAWQLLLYLFV